MAVAIAVGRNGVDTLLVASQVALSIVLPFIVFPLLWVTGSKEVMSVRKPVPPSSASVAVQPVDALDAPPSAGERVNAADVEADAVTTREETVDYSNGKIVATIGWIIWLIVLLANIYAIVTLAMGQGG